jgi:hypothetical protein
MPATAIRHPWPQNFPPVIAQAPYRLMVNHAAYRAAKDGESAEAALSLVVDCISDTANTALRAILRGLTPRVVSVHAEEATGRNKIPTAYGEVLSSIHGLYTDPGIVQASVANHGQAQSIYHRFVSQPTFDGYVEPGVQYLLVDDTCTAGGTLTNMKGFIEANGGIVVGMSVVASRLPGLKYDISLASSTLARIKYRHPGLDALWRQEFGYGIDTLTEGEAGHLLAAPSVDTIRNRLAEARRDLHLIGDQSADEPAPESAGSVNQEATGGKTPPGG